MCLPEMWIPQCNAGFIGGDAVYDNDGGLRDAQGASTVSDCVQAVVFGRS